LKPPFVKFSNPPTKIIGGIFENTNENNGDFGIYIKKVRISPFCNIIMYSYYHDDSNQQIFCMGKTSS